MRTRNRSEPALVLLLGSAASLFCFSASSKYWARQILTYPSRAAALTGGEQRGTTEVLTPSILMRHESQREGEREGEKKRIGEKKRRREMESGKGIEGKVR